LQEILKVPKSFKIFIDLRKRFSSKAEEDFLNSPIYKIDLFGEKLGLKGWSLSGYPFEKVSY